MGLLINTWGLYSQVLSIDSQHRHPHISIVLLIPTHTYAIELVDKIVTSTHSIVHF